MEFLSYFTSYFSSPDSTPSKVVESHRSINTSEVPRSDFTSPSANSTPSADDGLSSDLGGCNSNSNDKNSSEFDSPACNTRSRKKPCVLVDWQPKLNVRGGLSPLDASTPENLKKPTSRKSSKTFSTHKMQALNPELVNAQLEILKTSMQCCALACFTWMTLGMVMGWRLEYVDLESHKRRREWLERKFDEMDNSLPSSSTISFDYALSVRGYEKGLRQSF